VKRLFLPTGEWVETQSIPRAIAPSDSDWRENPYYKYNEKDLDGSDIDVWNEARLGKMTGAMDRIHVQKSLDTAECKRLCRYFRIFAENIAGTTWFLKRDPIARALYARKMAPVIAHARHAEVVANRREDVDNLYDFLVANGIDPV